MRLRIGWLGDLSCPLALGVATAAVIGVAVVAGPRAPDGRSVGTDRPGRGSRCGICWHPNRYAARGIARRRPAGLGLLARVRGGARVPPPEFSSGTGGPRVSARSGRRPGSPATPHRPCPAIPPRSGPRPGA